MHAYITYITLHCIPFHSIPLHYIHNLHTYPRTYIHACMHAYMHTCIHRLHTLHTIHILHAYMHTCIHRLHTLHTLHTILQYIYYIHTLHYIHTLDDTTLHYIALHYITLHTYLTYIHIYMHIYRYIYIYIYIFIYVCSVFIYIYTCVCTCSIYYVCTYIYIVCTSYMIGIDPQTYLVAEHGGDPGCRQVTIATTLGVLDSSHGAPQLISSPGKNIGKMGENVWRWWKCDDMWRYVAMIREDMSWWCRDDMSSWCVMILCFCGSQLSHKSWPNFLGPARDLQIRAWIWPNSLWSTGFGRLHVRLEPRWITQKIQEKPLNTQTWDIMSWDVCRVGPVSSCFPRFFL